MNFHFLLKVWWEDRYHYDVMEIILTAAAVPIRNYRCRQIYQD